MGPLKSGYAARVKRERERAARPPPNASGCFIFPREPAAAERSSPLSRCAQSTCQRARRREEEREERVGGRGGEKLARQMTRPHHTTSLPPPVIHKASPSLSVFLSPSRRFLRATRSWLTGGADILGGVIPGVESLRSPCCDPVIPGRGRVLEACRERKRVYIKTTFRPRGCITAPLHGYK